jgi:ABC-type lipoprotein export system ATPase subunit
MLLEAKDLGYKIGERTLFQNLSLLVKPNSVLVIEGPSGVGKSSLLKLFSKELSPSKGSMERNSIWGEIPQHLALNEELSALANVHLGLLKGLSLFEALRVQQDPRVEKLLKRFGIVDLKRPLKFFSGGEKQRVAIVRALVEPWKILFADEPISQLDEENAEKAIQALKEEAFNRGGALVLVLHHPKLAKKYGTDFLKMGEP